MESNPGVIGGSLGGVITTDADGTSILSQSSCVYNSDTETTVLEFTIPLDDSTTPFYVQSGGVANKVSLPLKESIGPSPQNLQKRRTMSGRKQ